MIQDYLYSNIVPYCCYMSVKHLLTLCLLKAKMIVHTEAILEVTGVTQNGTHNSVFSPLLLWQHISSATRKTELNCYHVLT